MRLKFGFETLPWFSIQIESRSRRWIVAGRIHTGAVSLYAARQYRFPVSDTEQRASSFLMTLNTRFRASAPESAFAPESASRLVSCPIS